MRMLLIWCLMVVGVGGETISGTVRRKILKSAPEIAEFDPVTFQVRREMILRGGDPVNVKAESGRRPHFMIQTICRKCMESSNFRCVSELCLIQDTQKQQQHLPGLHDNKEEDVAHQAFITGTTMQADILCSLCKSTRDVMCTMQLCANPNRDEIVGGDSSVQCTDDFCRWQKNTILSHGYSNTMYNGWLQPSSWYVWFEDVAKELGQVYGQIQSLRNLLRTKK